MLRVYSILIVYNFAPGPVRKVKKVEVMEQAVSLVLAEELIHFPTVYAFDINFVLYVAAGLEIQSHKVFQ